MEDGAEDRAARRSPWVRALKILLIAFLILLTVAVIKIGPYLFEPNRYEGVVSIERRADYRDPRLIAAAWSLPVARTYRRDGLEYQSNPSFCGPASVANLLRSTGQAASQDGVIDGTAYEPWFGVLIGGLTIDELARLLSLKTGAPVTIVRDPSLAAFRAALRRANDPALRMIVNFHRGPMFGRGHGHFSPVLAYLPERDLVLIGDVNAEYRPYLVPTDRLWRATDTVDAETGKERGLIVVRVPQRAG